MSVDMINVPNEINIPNEINTNSEINVDNDINILGEELINFEDNGGNIDNQNNGDNGDNGNNGDNGDNGDNIDNGNNQNNTKEINIKPIEIKLDEIPQMEENLTLGDKYIACFKPEEGRIRVKVDEKAKQANNPRDIFDNTKSHIPWDDTGRFNKPEEMADLINNNNSHIKHPLGKILGYAAIAVAPYVYIPLKHRGVKDGTFSEVVGSLRSEIRLPGHHFLLRATDKWGKSYPLDDEKHNLIEIGNNTILRVRANHIGVAHLVGDKEGVGKDGDVVLFSQGSYVLNESRYRDITWTKIDPTQKIITIGNVVILNIPEGWVGGATFRSNNKSYTWNYGAPILLDTKEWSNIVVTKRNDDKFNVGEFIYLTVTEGEIAFIKNKNGTYKLITKPNTYRLHSKEWEKYGKYTLKDNMDIAIYYIRTVEEGYIGVVQDLRGNWYKLKTGKYMLSKKEFKEPIIKRIDGPQISMGNVWYLRVQKDYLTGAWNSETGKFDIFEGDDKLLILSKKQYPTITRINKISYSEQLFGQYKVITIPNGMMGIFEENGDLLVKEPRTYTDLNPITLIRESLPKQPQCLSIKNILFRTQDRFEMAANAALLMTIDDYIKVSRRLIAENIKYSSLQSDLCNYAGELLKKKLKEYRLADLAVTEKDNQQEVNANYEKVINISFNELTSYGKDFDVGIKFQQLEFIGAIELTDNKVITDFANIAKSRIAEKAAKEEGLANMTKAEEDAKVKIKLQETEKIIRLKKQETESEVNIIKSEADAKIRIHQATANAESDKKTREIQLEIETKEREKRALAECKEKELKIATECKNREIQASIELKERESKAKATAIEIKLSAEARANEIKLTADAKANEIKITADATTYKIEKENDAQIEAENKRNKVAKEMPSTLLLLKQKELDVEAMKHLAHGKKYGSVMEQIVKGFAPHLKLGGNGEHLKHVLGTVIDDSNMESA